MIDVYSINGITLESRRVVVIDDESPIDIGDLVVYDGDLHAFNPSFGVLLSDIDFTKIVKVKPPSWFK